MALESHASRTRIWLGHVLWQFLERSYLYVSWEDILNWGTIVVPETTSYISDVEVNELEEIGFDRLPLNSNHIVGFKGGVSC